MYEFWSFMQTDIISNPTLSFFLLCDRKLQKFYREKILPSPKIDVVLNFNIIGNKLTLLFKAN